MEKPAERGELRIFNQFVETFSVNDLAERIKRVGNSFNLNVQIRSVENPRKELEEHYYNPVHTGLLNLGLTPLYLTDDVLAGMIETVLIHKESIHKSAIYRGVQWG
jgi:UDP-sulfoquinovose synthase